MIWCICCVSVVTVVSCFMMLFCLIFKTFGIEVLFLTLAVPLNMIMCSLSNADSIKAKQKFCYVHGTKILCNNKFKSSVHIYVYASDVHIFTTYELLNSVVY